MRMIKKLHLSLLFLLIFNCISAQLSETVSADRSGYQEHTLFRFIYSETELPEIILHTDLKQIFKNKYSLDKLPSKLEYRRGDIQEEWDIEVNIRGRSRRRICNFPPLKLHFSKDDLASRGMKKKFNTLKLVTHCKNTDRYENYVLREYVAYKLYNILTDYSFRVQLVNIEYRDIHDRLKPIRRVGFLIEDIDEVARRLNAKEEDMYDFRRDSLNHFHYDMMSLFQYMISNSDWDLSTLHNVKMIEDRSTGEFYAIPYDFDYSGFVNAVYSVPNPSINQVDVTERIYQGKDCTLEGMLTVREHFLSKKDEILNFRQEGFVDNSYCEKMIGFIKSFYRTIENDKKFRRKCLN